MTAPTKELPIPAAALGDEKAIELARVWIANGAQHVALATQVWDDPAAWGIMLVDLAKHVANSYAQEGKMGFVDALARIKLGIDVEWQDATDEPSGQVTE